MLTAAALAGVAVGVAAIPAAAAVARPALEPCSTQADTGTYPPGDGQIGLQVSQEYAGQGNVVGGGGFARVGEPGALGTVQLQICSSPESLGTATLAADGTFSEQITIPVDIPPGEHIVQAQGPNGRGGVQTLTTRVTIIARPAPGISTTTGNLPLTGLDLVPLIVTALLLIATGTGLVVVVRARRQRQITA